ncbi:MAG: hypothetical protein HC882_00175 [Acidobacteria bacterium]|nr:hypothetical protein [Acidobacteriota bacterium]
MEHELRKLTQNPKIIHAPSIRELHKVINGRQPLSCVFLDMNFRGPDDDYALEALVDLYDLWSVRPEVPYCIVSGYVNSKSNELLKAAFDIPPLVEALDKMTYCNSDVSDALRRAAAYRDLYSRSQIAKPTTPAAAEQSERNQLKRDIAVSDTSLQDFFRSPNLVSRAKEEERFRGHAAFTALEVCIQLDRLVTTALRLQSTGESTFEQRLQQLRDLLTLDSHACELLRCAWRIRNRIVHPPYLRPSATDVEKLVRGLTRLQEACACGTRHVS